MTRPPQQTSATALLVAALLTSCGSGPEATPTDTTTAPPIAAARAPGTVDVIEARPRHPWPPPPVPPIDPERGAARPGEGEWAAVPSLVEHNPGAPPLMFQTTLTHRKVKRDRRSGKAIDLGGEFTVRLVVWDPEQTSLRMVAGKATPTPDRRGVRGGGRLPVDLGELQRVVAAFNGGWRTKHAPRSGMMVNKTLVRAPSHGQATVATYADGRVEMGTWPQGAPIPDDMVELRQNIEPLYADGAFNPLGRTELWGFTNGVKGADGPWTVRSALCRTEAGDGLYIWGQHMTERELTTVMERARCAYGIHLDMNYAWATWEYYNIKGLRAMSRRVPTAASPGGGPRFYDWDGAKIGPESPSPLPRYLKPDPKDFFYLLREPTLPSAPMGELTFAPLPQPGTARRRPAAVRATHPGGVRLIMWSADRFQRPALPADAERAGGLQLSVTAGSAPDDWDTALVFGRDGDGMIINDRSGADVAGWVLARGALLTPSRKRRAPTTGLLKIAAVRASGEGVWMEGDASQLEAMLQIAADLGCYERMLLMPPDAALTAHTLAASSTPDAPAWVGWDGFSERGHPWDPAQAPPNTLTLGLPAEAPVLGDLSLSSPTAAP